MRPPKINDRVLLRLIDVQQMSQSESAKELGVSRQAVSKRLQELRGKTTKVVIAKKVEAVVDRKIDAMAQLQKINQDANEILDLLMRWNRGEDDALQVLENQVKRIRIGDEGLTIKEVKFKDPRQLALQAMSEIRNQLKLQLDIFQALYDLKAAQEFQDEILTAIGEVDPDVRAKIIHKLNEKQVIRSAIKFN